MYKLIFVLGLLCIGFGAKAFIDFQSFKNSPVRVIGQIIEKTPAGSWMRLPQQARVVVRYTYEGREFTVGNTALSKRWVEFKRGDSAELILIPSRPSKFILADSLGDTSVLAPALIAFGSVLLAVSFFIQKYGVL